MLKTESHGKNYPPIHANDRCTTVAEFDDEVMEGIQRRARDPITGKTYLINQNSVYDEWKEQVDSKYGKGTVDLEHKKYTNLKADKEQYKRYRNVIGKENMPNTIEKWQDLKYNDIKEYRLTKYNYKLQNEVVHNPQNIIDSIDIAEDKYTKYLFVGSNKDGLIKGKLINDVLGYNIDNYKELDKLIKNNINKFPSRYKGNNQYGNKYEVNMVVKGLKGRQAKLTIGALESNNNIKLTSVYISELKESELKYDKYQRY